MKIIGTGLGRTGTYSLKLALNALGLGPCYHMEVVAMDRPRHVPLWNDALAGEADWGRIYEGFESAVDWPTAGFFRELYKQYPDAKYVHTTRTAESWAESFGSTIFKLLAGRDQAPGDVTPWLEMTVGVLQHTGFSMDANHDDLIAGFKSHEAAVKEVIPPGQLLVFDLKEGWAPLCEFLGVEAPQEALPRSNNREEFWDLVSSAN